MPSPDEIRIITVAAFVVMIVMGLKRPVWAVLAYMILVYCKLSSYYAIFATIKAELVFAILILLRIFLSNNATGRLSLKYNKVNQYLFFFVLCVCLSFVVAWDHQYSWDIKVYHFIKVLILYTMLLGGVAERNDLVTFIVGFMLMFAYLAYEPTYYFVSGSGGKEYIYGTNYIAQIGILSGHVALANNMNQMIPIALFAFLGFQNKLIKGTALICLIVFLLALIGSGSRGGVAGFAFFGLAFVYFSKNRSKAIILVGLPLLILLLSSGRMSNTLARIDSDSFWGRFIGLTHGIGMLKKGNVLGVGPGCYLLARRAYFSYGMESHNIYGQAIGDLGIPGTIAWALFLYAIFHNLNAVKRRFEKNESSDALLYFIAKGIQISLLVRLFISFGSHGLYYFYWYVMAFLSIAIISLTETNDDAEKGKPEEN